MKVVIVGGGYGGTEVIRQLVLRGAGNLEIELISNKSRFENTIGGLELISEKMKPEELMYDLKVLSSYWDFKLTIGEVKNIDLDSKVLKIGDREDDYDVLIIATGSEPNFYHVNGANQTQPAYNLSDFLNINRKLKQLDATTPNIVIVGSGFVGLEATAEILDLFDAIKKKVKVTVIEKMKTILPAYNNPSARKEAFDNLSSRGINFILGNGIKQAEKEDLILEGGSSVSSDLTIWTAGVKGCPLLSQIAGVNLLKGCIEVDERLMISGRKDALVIGDASYVKVAGKEAMKMAAEALEQAKTVAKNIILISQDKKPEISYVPKYTTDYPSAILSMGRGKAMLIFGPEYVSVGSTEYFLKKRVDVNEIMERFPQ